MAKEKAEVNGIVGKLVEILKEIGPMEKSERNTHFGYNYTGEGQVMAELRGRLATRDLFLTTSVETCIPEYGEGKAGVYVAVTTRHRFIDTSTGEQFPPEDKPALGGAGLGWDSGDKGVYKAITGAVKYFLMKNFLITDHQDPESGEQRTATGSDPSAKKSAGHRRTRDYESETGQGDKKVATDYAELTEFLGTNQIPEGFLVALLKEKKLVEPNTVKLANIKPGVLRRCLAPASKANLVKAWAAQQADDTETKAAPRTAKQKEPANAKKEVRTREGDQTREGSRREPVVKGVPLAVIGQSGHDDWRTVCIHFGDKDGTALGKLTRKSLVWWIENWTPKPYRGSWDDEDILLDAALCLAAAEIGGEN